MAGGMDSGGGGKGKRPLDTPINVVPFIDLMAVTISFLIMTAVWNQIGRLQVTQEGSAADTPPASESKTMPINLLVTDRGFTLSSGAGTVEIPKVGGAYVFCHANGADKVADDGCDESASLIGALKKVKAEVPDQRNITVQAEDAVKYRDLVKVIDACNLEDGQHQPLLFPDVAVSAIG